MHHQWKRNGDGSWSALMPVPVLFAILAMAAATPAADAEPGFTASSDLLSADESGQVVTPVIRGDLTIELQPGFSYTEFAELSGPYHMTFDLDGNMYVGNDTGHPGPARIYRISDGGCVIEEFGEFAIPDPDAVQFDETGNISGVAGSILVSSRVAQGPTYFGELFAIRPDQQIVSLIGPTTQLGDPNDLAFDSSGRLLIVDGRNARVLTSVDGVTVSQLFSQSSSTGAYIAVWPRQDGDHLFTSIVNGMIREYAANGTLINNTFATGMGHAMITVSPGDAFWGEYLYALNPSTGQLYRFDENGASTLIGSGFNTTYGDIAFGPDGALYVSLTQRNRILRITSDEDDIQMEPGYAYTTYAHLSGPYHMTFDPAGNMFVGNNTNHPAPAKLYRIPAGGCLVEEYGESAIPDPDAVLYDELGQISGVPGSVLVGSSILIPTGGASIHLGQLVAVRPDGDVDVLIWPNMQFRDPNDLAFDSAGRLLIVDGKNAQVLESFDGHSAAHLFSQSPSTGAYLAVAPRDDGDHLFTSTVNGVIHEYAADGSVINNSFATGMGHAMITVGPGGDLWGDDLYALNPNTGQLFRFDAFGAHTLIASGFDTVYGDIAFGPDGALYVSLAQDDRILRITRELTPPTCHSAGPYAAECQGEVTSLQLDSSASTGSGLSYDWTTDCPGGSFDDPTSASPTLTLDTVDCSVNCTVSLTVENAVGVDSCTSGVSVIDSTAPSVTCSATPVLTGEGGIELQPGLAYTEFAELSGPYHMTFDNDGNMYVGNDTGHPGPARIYRIPAGGGIVQEFGEMQIPDADAVLFDETGSVSGVPGSILVSSRVSSGTVYYGEIFGIAPDQQVESLIGPTTQLGDPNDLALDSAGRLLIVDGRNARVLVSDDGTTVSTLFSQSPSTGAYIAVWPRDDGDHLFTSTVNGIIHEYAADGSVINNSFATGMGHAMITVGPGDEFWGGDLYALNPNSGQLVRFDESGASTLIGAGFNTVYGDIAFGPDGALYVSLTQGNRILRITQSDVETTILQIDYEAADDCSAATASAVIETSCGSVEVAAGQIVHLTCTDEDDCSGEMNASGSVSFEVAELSRLDGLGLIDPDGPDEGDDALDVAGSSATLVVTAVDDCGNESTCELELCSNGGDE